MYTWSPAGGRIDILQVRALTLYLAETEDGRTCFSPTDRFFTRGHRDLHKQDFPTTWSFPSCFISQSSFAEVFRKCKYRYDDASRGGVSLTRISLSLRQESITMME